MRISVFEPSETLVLLDAQERVIDQLGDTHVVTDAVKWKVANIVLKIGRLKQKCDVQMHAAEIAMDAIVMLMNVRALSGEVCTDADRTPAHEPAGFIADYR